MEPRHAGEHPTVLELLELREELAMDDRRRLKGLCGVTLAATRDSQALFVGSEVPEALLPALADAVDRAPVSSKLDEEPAALAACRAILTPACAPLNLSAGPVYLIQPYVRVDGSVPTVRSDVPPAERPLLVSPGNWDPDEWDDLLAGALGPWAMAVVDGRVASIAHTPGPMSARAAEVGVWTGPDFRGRGYAAAVTAAWADILRPTSRLLFYSTDATNLSSQRVAERLEARVLGWTWGLHRADPTSGDTRHPLSRERH